MGTSGGTARPEDRLARRGGWIECLRVPAALFAWGAGCRARLYDRGWLPSARLDVPVVCVGNLTAGGTGKTPMVRWVVERLLARGMRPGILSRGYGARGSEPNDEARELARLLPDVPHVQDADRIEGGRELERRGVDAIVMDDGFQHRRLARDLDLVLVDATRPWGLRAPTGGGSPVRAFLPRGLLRESPAALARADAVVLTRTDQVEARELAELRAELQRWAPGVGQALTRHEPVALRSLEGATTEPEAWRGREVDLMSAIGNPSAFEDSARRAGLVVRQHRRFPDHHAPSPAELADLGRERPVVVTAKDLVKLRAEDWRDRTLVALDVELVVDEGAAVLEALFDALPLARAVRERNAYREGLHG